MAVLSLEGATHLSIMGYDIHVHIGAFLLAIIILLWVASLILNVIRAIARAPKTMMSHFDKNNQSKGLQSLAFGLSAIAAGDARLAKNYAHRASKYLKNDYGLSNLLNGMSARLSGDEKQADKAFNALLNHKETSFLGVKGLMQTAMDKGDYRYAHVLAKRAYAENPKQEWIIKILYDLEIKTNNYDAAIALLPMMVKTKSINRDCATKDKASLMLAQGKAAAAYKENPKSLPVILAHVSELIEGGKRRKSLNIIKKSWADNPHSKLLEYWVALAPKKTIDNPLAMMVWVEDLQRLNKQDAASALYAAAMAIKFKQNDTAKRFLRAAIEIYPTIRAYQYMAQIDPQNRWMDHVVHAHHDKAWVCGDTGRIYNEWVMVGDNGRFNTIEWIYPDELKISRPKIQNPSGNLLPLAA